MNPLENDLLIGNHAPKLLSRVPTREGCTAEPFQLYSELAAVGRVLL